MAAHKDMSNTMTDDAQVVRVARHVTWVGFWINALLGVAKVLAGVFGRSAAMVADGVHSFSDFVSDIIVIVFIGISRRKADERYQYGHGKYETFATMLLSLILAAVAVMFFVDGAEKTWGALHGAEIPSPTYLALGMCVVSIVSKEWLYRYTRRAGERIGSAVVVANAWHHRSDALSSLATMAGVGGAMFLGPHWRVLDPIAAMVVSVFIAIVAVQLGKPAIQELLEVSLPKETVKEMYSVIGTTPGGSVPPLRLPPKRQPYVRRFSYQGFTGDNRRPRPWHSVRRRAPSPAEVWRRARRQHPRRALQGSASRQI